MSSSRRNFLRSLSIASLATATSKVSPTSASACNVAANSPISLDKNENPYGPSPKVLEAIHRASGDSGSYPRNSVAELVDRIAQLHKVDANRVILGAGSTEILRVACAAFLSNGTQFVQPAVTYSDAEACARSAGAQVLSDPLTRKLEFDLDAMLSHSGSGLVYICNPNNPTGTITPRRQLESFFAKLPGSYKILIDEAYHEFCPPSGSYASFLDRPLQDERIIVTRTFSLAYGLAGLRVGYGIASPEAVDRMRPLLTQNGVNNIALQAAAAALDDTSGLTEAVRRNADARQDFLNQCTGRSLKPLDSHTNFYSLNIFNPANLIIRYFRDNHVLIAPVTLSWDTYIRVSFGKPQDMKTFWELWDKAPLDKSAIRH
jgi:histidinol-phosphate aminotransferase